MNIRHGKQYLVIALIPLIAGISILNASFYFYWQPDDVYIPIRYLYNFIEFKSFNFNSNDLNSAPTQGFTSAGIMPIYWLLLKVSSDVILSLKILGTAIFAALSVSIYLLTLKLTRNLAVAFCTGIFSSVSSIFGWSSVSGLETIFLAALLVIAFTVFIRNNSIWNQVLSGFLFGYSFTMRPEVVLLLTLVLLLAWGKISDSLDHEFHHVPSNGKITFIVVSGFTYLTFMFIQYSIYAQLFPNTASAKATPPTFIDIFSSARYKYLYDFMFYNWSLFVFLLLSVISFVYFFKSHHYKYTSFGLLLFLLPGLGLGFVGQSDYFPNFRYYVPYLPFLILFVGINVSILIENNRTKFLAKTLLIILFATMVITEVRTNIILNNQNIFSWQIKSVQKSSSNYVKFRGQYWTPFAIQSRLVAEYTPMNGTIAYGNIGRVGIAAMDVRILDTVGLTSKEFAEFRKNGDAAPVMKLLNDHKPDLYIVGIGDQQLLSLIKDLVAQDYVEKDWLQEVGERVFIRRELVTSSGDSIVHPTIVNQRKSVVARLIPNDQDIYSGGR